jgi:hypothetical protein
MLHARFSLLRSLLYRRCDQSVFLSDITRTDYVYSLASDVRIYF